MDLSRLVAPGGEKTVLMVGEYHEDNELDQILSLCESFGPDAIAIEMQADRLIRYDEIDGIRTLLDEIRGHPDRSLPETLLDYQKTISAMNGAAMYAAHHNLPLYLADWHPTAPENIGDYFAGKAPNFIHTKNRERRSWKWLVNALEHTMGTLFGPGWSGELDPQLRDALESRPPETDDSDVMALTESTYCAKFFLYSGGTPHGHALRNEYTAMVLNSIDAERILYVGGAGHFRRTTYHGGRRFHWLDSADPLQKLVAAPHKHYVDLPAHKYPAELQRVKEEFGTDEFSIRITETQPIALPWHLLDYMRDNGGSR